MESQPHVRSLRHRLPVLVPVLFVAAFITVLIVQMTSVPQVSRILVLCMDYRRSADNKPIFSGAPSQTSDAIMVIEVNQKTKKTTVCQIPRDTMTYVSKRLGWDKVNTSISEVGARESCQVVGRLMNKPIDHFVVMTIPDFISLFDTIGGIDVPGKSIEGLTAISKGAVEQARKSDRVVLKGRDTLIYVMERVGSDAERRERQELFISSLLRQRKNMGAFKAAKVVGWARGLNMDLSLVQAAQYARLVLRGDREFQTIPTGEVYLNRRSYLVPAIPTK